MDSSGSHTLKRRRYSRSAWIPAFAGMTVGFGSEGLAYSGSGATVDAGTAVCAVFITIARNV
jgi:hypothetical protein